MRVKFWGTRGSIATPGPGTVHFGGNTSCVEVTTDAGVRFILDCGTGARLLGLHLMANCPKPLQGNLLLSHTHWDHIQGFPFFVPLFVPGNRFSVYAPQGAGASLGDVLSGQMEFTYFPVELSQLPAQLQYVDLPEGIHEIDGVRVLAQFLNHPAVALGYRIQCGNASVVYLCDHEPFSETLWRSDAEPGKLDSILHAGDRRHAQFMACADLVIHDAQYTPDEYPTKKNWGHSTYEYAVEMAALAGVKRLALMHHDPGHDDAFIQGIEDAAREVARRRGSSMEVFCAVEGAEILLRPTEQPTDSHIVLKGSGAIGHTRILVADDDPDVRLLVRRALGGNDYEIREAGNGLEALKSIDANPPDLVILDVLMPGIDGLQVLKKMRSNPQTAQIPVIILTSMTDETTTRDGFDTGAADFLTKPFSIPQLATRVKVCLARRAETR
ncbi:MAG: response regulator [Bryobacteraceae bacterium]|nr:response regulator [Bryobacteraceae bacterium]